ncbi:Hypothetical protein NTJ_00969 [Nesidiocoris tenuis]|uniref:Odorant receptor n=1 Tax=Nesidiocoris tenuis TaxID=355587 RepID=A0ABN7A869_9HEMI|nr:Hypothetical protein NTJ_00969 [Nesidiocoris tenuis]
MPLPSTSMPHLRKLMDYAGVLQDEKNSFFPKGMYTAWTVIVFASYWVMIVSSLVYCWFEANTREETHKKLNAVTLCLSTAQMMFSHCALLLNREKLRCILNEFDSIYDDVKGDSNNYKDLSTAEHKSRTFLTNIIIPGCLAVVLPAYFQAVVRIFVTGEYEKPFKMSYLGMNVFVGEFVHIWSLFSAVVFVVTLYTSVDGLIAQLTVYTAILSRMIQSRPAQPDEAYDKKMLELFCKISRLGVSTGQLFGETGFLEIVFSTVKSGFPTYHVIMAISTGRFDLLITAASFTIVGISFNFFLCFAGEKLQSQMDAVSRATIESNWADCKPSARKPISLLLTLSATPLVMHFRRYAFLNFAAFTSICRGVYSLISILSNFVR